MSLYGDAKLRTLGDCILEECNLHTSHTSESSTQSMSS